MVGAQECGCDLHEWEVLLQQTLGPSHVLIHSRQLGALHMAAFIRRDLLWHCSGGWGSWQLGGALGSWVGLSAVGWGSRQLGGALGSWVGLLAVGWGSWQLGGALGSWVRLTNM